MHPAVAELALHRGVLARLLNGLKIPEEDDRRAADRSLRAGASGGAGKVGSWRVSDPRSPDRLSPGLREFVPVRWVLPGEDTADPIAVHYTARARWREACADALGLPLNELPPDDGWHPIPGRIECPCSVCSPRS